jgi:hypothetical protein
MTRLDYRHIDTPQGRSLWRRILQDVPKAAILLRYIENEQRSSPSLQQSVYLTSGKNEPRLRIPSPYTANMVLAAPVSISSTQNAWFRIQETNCFLITPRLPQKHADIFALIFRNAESMIGLQISRETALSEQAILQDMEALSTQDSVLLQKYNDSKFEPKESVFMGDS